MSDDASNLKVCYLVYPNGGGFKARMDKVHNNIILPVLRKHHYHPIRSDEIYRRGEITTEIIEHLNAANIVIGELTDYYPTVLYELGIRHAFGKPTILILERGQPIPTDLLLLLMKTVVYDVTNANSVENAVERLDQLIQEIEDEKDSNGSAVFISCNHKDVQLAQVIGENLKTSNCQPRLYEWDVPPGDSFIEFMEESIKTSKVMVLLWSKHANDSYWVTEEYRSFHMKISDDSSSKMILIWLDDTPVPPLLRDKRWISHKGDDKDLDKLIKQLLWGITGKFPHDFRTLPSLQNEIVQRKDSYPLPYIFCPRCGSTNLQHEYYSIEEEGIEMAEVQCKECGWKERK